MEDLELKHLFGGTFAGRRVLVTGHTGFKGSWLMLWLQKMGATIGGIGLDPDSDPSHWSTLDLDIEMDARVDLRDAAAISETVLGFRPDIIFHLGAQSLVRRGYADPKYTFETNVIGLVNVLEASRRCDSIRAIINATTDKVYEPPHAEDGYSENDPLGGHDPYSASKACAEIVSLCYRRSYLQAGTGRAIGLATARAGNVIGGGDWAEDRLVPDLVRAAVSGSTLCLRNPSATRPWQHVLEPLSGYLLLAKGLLEGEPLSEGWNFGPSPDATMQVREMVDRLKNAWPTLAVEHDQSPQPHEAGQLRLNSEKSRRRLGWRPVWNANTTVDRTVSWYLAHTRGDATRSDADLRAYVEEAGRSGLAWAA